MEGRAAVSENDAGRRDSIWWPYPLWSLFLWMVLEFLVPTQNYGVGWIWGTIILPPRCFNWNRVWQSSRWLASGFLYSILEGLLQERSHFPWCWWPMQWGGRRWPPHSLIAAPHPLQTGPCSLTSPIASPSPPPSLQPEHLHFQPYTSLVHSGKPKPYSEMDPPSLQRAKTIIVSLDSRRWGRVSPPSPRSSPGIPSRNTRCTWPERLSLMRMLMFPGS